MNKYEVTIGIEIHCELKTRTKMFSGAPVSFGETANTCTSVVDLAMPGTLPCVNKEAVRLAVKACTGLGCTIDPLVKFDRKNYYYADLPKGFQITQQFHPIGRDGKIVIETEDGKKEVRIERIHMEEDTAKQFHRESGTYLDFNRAGIPLVEIVSRPDMHSAAEAAAYVDALRKIVTNLNVSDGKMEEGSLRCDINISLSDQPGRLGVKTEIKNLNSIANIQKAVQAEIDRQTALLEKGEKVEQATRRYDEAQKTTVLMRKKEGAVDYKYFPEPNIFPILLDSDWIREIQENMEELPDARCQRFMTQYGLNEYDAGLLSGEAEVAAYFEAGAVLAKDAKKLANWINGDLAAFLNKAGRRFQDNPVPAEDLAVLVNVIEDGTISGKQAKTVFEEMVLGRKPLEIIEEKGLRQVSDEGQLLEQIRAVLDENPASIADFKAGKKRAAGFLMGQLMKKTKGQANPKTANGLLMQELAKR